jgi:hypothetical protein
MKVLVTGPFDPHRHGVSDVKMGLVALRASAVVLGGGLDLAVSEAAHELGLPAVDEAPDVVLAFARWSGLAWPATEVVHGAREAGVRVVLVWLRPASWA